MLAAALAIAPAMLTGCGRSAPPRRAAGPARPFTAAFVIPGAGKVRLDYRDDACFRLAADAGPGATLAVDGEIYLHVAPSLAAPEPRLLHLGRLGPLTEAASEAPALTPADVPADRRARWGLRGACWRSAMPPPVPGGASAELLVGDVPDLAHGQHVIGVRLRDSMDMAMCGDVVGRLLASWPRAVTGGGLAILAHGSGMELAAPLRLLDQRISLPVGVSVEDYRLRPA